MVGGDNGICRNDVELKLYVTLGNLYTTAFSYKLLIFRG